MLLILLNFTIKFYHNRGFISPTSFFSSQIDCGLIYRLEFSRFICKMRSSPILLKPHVLQINPFVKYAKLLRRWTNENLLHEQNEYSLSSLIFSNLWSSTRRPRWNFCNDSFNGCLHFAPNAPVHKIIYAMPFLQIPYTTFVKCDKRYANAQGLFCFDRDYRKPYSLKDFTFFQMYI